MFQKGYQYFNRKGVVGSLKLLYQSKVRGKLPKKNKKFIKLNGIKVPSQQLDVYDTRLFDEMVGIPNYESYQISNVENYISKGETVVEVGAGIGITTIKIANEIGASGKLVSYEATETGVKKLEENLDYYDVSSLVDVRCGVVGEANHLRGDATGTNIEPIDPSELPDCNTLVMDCEGAELTVINNMNINPDKIIVETHSDLGSPHEEVAERLNSLSYEISESIELDNVSHIVAINE